MDQNVELSVSELAQQVVKAQHHHVDQHVVVHDFRAGHADQRQDNARVHARRKCLRYATTGRVKKSIFFIYR